MSRFSDVARDDVHRFVAEHPLAWIVPVRDPEAAVLMPILFENADCSSMIGHLPLRVSRNPAFDVSRSVACLFLGPHSYISPEWAGKDDWVPTWNFLSLKVVGEILFSDELTRPAVEFLVDHMQANSTSDWSTAQVEHRMPSLLRRIIGFRIRVTSLAPRFKLGQDEDSTTYARIEAHLSKHALATWMHR
ncbi:MAG: FMN-binding negative transcriptional regulator [Pseudomonadota bacterium]